MENDDIKSWDEEKVKVSSEVDCANVYLRACSQEERKEVIPIFKQYFSNIGGSFNFDMDDPSVGAESMRLTLEAKKIIDSKFQEKFGTTMTVFLLKHYSGM